MGLLSMHKPTANQTLKVPPLHHGTSITLMQEGKARMIGGDCTEKKVHSVCLFKCVFVVCTCVHLWKMESEHVHGSVLKVLLSLCFIVGVRRP